MGKPTADDETALAALPRAETTGDRLALVGASLAALVALATSVAGLAAAISTADMVSARGAFTCEEVVSWGLAAALWLSVPSLAVLGAALAARPRRPVRLVAAILSAGYCLGVLTSICYAACVLD
jgi:hypothetical protein